MTVVRQNRHGVRLEFHTGSRPWIVVRSGKVLATLGDKAAALAEYRLRCEAMARRQRIEAV